MASQIASYGAGNDPLVDADWWVPAAWVADVTKTTVTMETYVYDLRNILGGGHQYWWPTTVSGVGFAALGFGFQAVADVPGSQGQLGYSLKVLPNPVRAAMSVKLTLARSAPCSVKLFDVNGRCVRTLFSQMLTAGTHQMKWDMSGADGKRLSAGVYFVHMTSAGVERTARCVRLD